MRGSKARVEVSESFKAEKKINFMFVPVSAGVRGNECVNRLAGTAAVGIGQTKVRADIFNAIRDAGQKKDVSSDSECVALTDFRGSSRKVRVQTRGL